MINTNIEYNYGVALLRMILCFLVITCHYWDATDASGGGLAYIRNYAVLAFMVMSFFYSQDFLCKLSKENIVERFERLIIPQISWAVIYWSIYFIIDKLIGTKLEEGFGDLMWQIFTGHSPHINATMWYQVDLIFLTAIFICSIYFFKDKTNSVLWYMGIGAIIIQYTGINNVFSELRYELKYPLGRLAEMIPAAVIGYFIASKKIFSYLEKCRLLVIISSIVFLILNYEYRFFGEVDGYGYQGIEGVFVATLIFICFFLLPLQRLDNVVKKGILFLSRYTLGIYCMHRLVGTMLSLLINHYNISFIKENSLTECFIIYIVCYVIAWLGVTVFKNTKLKLIFI